MEGDTYYIYDEKHTLTKAAYKNVYITPSLSVSAMAARLQ